MANFHSTGWVTGETVTARAVSATPPYGATGSSVDSGTADANGAVDFAGLTEATPYLAAGGTSGRTARFQVPTPPASGDGVTVTVTGDPTVGEVLTATVSDIVTSPTYQWKRGGVNISGATSAMYTVHSADIGEDITCTVNGDVTATSSAVVGVAGDAIGAQPAAKSTGIYTSSFTAGGDFTWRIPHTAGPVDYAGLSLYYGLWKVDTASGEVAVGNEGTIKASVEYDGASYPVTFASGRSQACADGATVIGTCDLELPAGATFAVRTRLLAATFPYAQYYPGTNQTGDQVDGTGELSTQSASGGFGPFLIIGTPSEAINGGICVGDSITAGQGDPSGLGYFVRAFAGKDLVAAVVAEPGESAAAFNTSHAQRMLAAPGRVWATDAYGVNDIFVESRTAAQVNQNRTTVWQTLVAADVGNVYATTLTPVGSGAAAYSAGKELVRVAHNGWMRDGAPLDSGTLAPAVTGTVGALRAGDVGHPLTAVWEIADLAETARDSGIWKDAYSDDDVHPNETGAAALAAGVDTAALLGL